MNYETTNREKTAMTEILIATMAMTSPPFPSLGSITCKTYT